LIYKFHEAAISGALNDLSKVEGTEAQESNQPSYPQNGLLSFSGGFFGYFFPTKKVTIKITFKI
jgi:hypothetical protein